MFFYRHYRENQKSYTDMIDTLAEKLLEAGIEHRAYNSDTALEPGFNYVKAYASDPYRGSSIFRVLSLPFQDPHPWRFEIIVYLSRGVLVTAVPERYSFGRQYEDSGEDSSFIHGWYRKFNDTTVYDNLNGGSPFNFEANPYWPTEYDTPNKNWLQYQLVVEPGVGAAFGSWFTMSYSSWIWAGAQRLKNIETGEVGGKIDPVFCLGGSSSYDPVYFNVTHRYCDEFNHRIPASVTTDYLDPVINPLQQIGVMAHDSLDSLLEMPRNFSTLEYFYPKHAMHLIGYTPAQESNYAQVSRSIGTESYYCGMLTTSATACGKARIFTLCDQDWIKQELAIIAAEKEAEESKDDDILNGGAPT